MVSENTLSRRGFVLASTVTAATQASAAAAQAGGRSSAADGTEAALGPLAAEGSFINAFRFFSAEEIADATGYRGRLDLTRPLQRALDGAWSTNRDLFLPAGLYRVTGLMLPGTAAERARAFRFYGQGSGELFARPESGGTIIKGAPGVSVLRSKMSTERSGNGNQEVAYIRFEGDAPVPVLDFETLYAQSELHHCGIYQSGTGDGVRVRYANTIDIHHNYVLNRDWPEAGKRNRTGVGIHVTVVSDNGLLTLRKNTARGFERGIQLGEAGTGVLYSPRVEQCETSMCTDGIRFEETVRSGVIENCYLEGGDGGTGIYNAGNGNTLSNNHLFAGFAIGIDDTESAHATRITGNTLAAGNAQTVNRGGCTLIRIRGNGPAKLVQGNYLITDPVSFGPVERVVGLAVEGSAESVVAHANAFEPNGSWGSGRGTAKTLGLSGEPRPNALADVQSPEGLSSAIALSLPMLALPHLLDTDTQGTRRLVLPRGSWFDTAELQPATITEVESSDLGGGVVTLLDRAGGLRVEPGARVTLAGNAPFVGPGTLCLLVVPGQEGAHAYEVSRARF